MRHFTRDRSPFRVRLACVKHAASVQSEPESNSPVQICSKDLRWTEIRISKFLPVRYSLVNEPRRITRREAVVYAASFSLSTSFFSFRESFFAAPPGQLVGVKETYVSFSNPRQELFCHPGKFPSPSPLRTWPVRWRERLYAPFRPHRQAFFRKKFCILARSRRYLSPHAGRTRQDTGIPLCRFPVFRPTMPAFPLCRGTKHRVPFLLADQGRQAFTLRGEQKHGILLRKGGFQPTGIFPLRAPCPPFSRCPATKKGARRPPGHATSASCPTRHNFPAAPRDGDGPSPAFPYPRTGGPDGASSGRRSGRSCPPARPR